MTAKNFQEEHEDITNGKDEFKAAPHAHFPLFCFGCTNSTRVNGVQFLSKLITTNFLFVLPHAAFREIGTFVNNPPTILKKYLEEGKNGHDLQVAIANVKTFVYISFLFIKKYFEVHFLYL